MKRVVIYRSVLLTPSETFISDQAQALSWWSATLVGHSRAACSLETNGLDVRVPNRQSTTRRIRILQRLGLPDPTLVSWFRDFDLVHVHFATDAVDVWPSVRRAGLPMLVTLHGYDITTKFEWWRSGQGGLTRMSYPTRLMRLFQDSRVSFIAVSEAIRKHAISLGLPPQKIAMHYTGIDVDHFATAGTPVSHRERRVLFVGRLVEKKGVRYLIEAMKGVRTRLPDAVLTVVGDGPLRDTLTSQASHAGVPTEFLGHLSPPEVRRQFARARVFCLPSVKASNGDSEGFGMVLLESQACGVPVVTSAMGGANEGVIDGTTGLTFEERDVEGLAGALTLLLMDDELCNMMSMEAAKFVRQRFDVKQLTPGLELLYAQSLQHSPSEQKCNP